MPTVYEHVTNDRVDDRVQPVDAVDDFEATRLGVAALEAEQAAANGTLGDSYWRVQGTELVNAQPDTEVDKTASETESPQAKRVDAADTSADKPAAKPKTRKE